MSEARTVSVPGIQAPCGIGPRGASSLPRRSPCDGDCHPQSVPAPDLASVPIQPMPTSSLPAPGILYLVATPIGNLQDLTDRAKAVLAQVDLVVAEDTRRTRTLLSHLNLRKPIESLHRHSECEKTPGLVARLAQGTTVALVSDAGVPTISDPGTRLVAAAWEAGIRVIPVPGPSAALSALCVSGFPADRFLFAGYPPRRSAERRAFFRGFMGTTMPVVFYEAPHRLLATLDDALAELGPARLALIGREMTKHFEELQRGPLWQLREHYQTTEPVGEFTVVLGPPEAQAAVPAATGGDPARAAELLQQSGIPTRKAAQILAVACGLSRNEAYEMLLHAGSRGPQSGAHQP